MDKVKHVILSITYLSQNISKIQMKWPEVSMFLFCWKIYCFFEIRLGMFHVSSLKECNPQIIKQHNNLNK